MTDTEFRQLLAQSPQQGHRMLVEEYSNYVYAIVLNRLRSVASREDMEECVSDVFAEVFFSFSKPGGACGDLKLLIGTIAKRTAIDAFRKLRRQSGKTTEETALEQLAAEDSVPETAEKTLRRQKLLEVIRSLGEPDASILIYQYFFDRSAGEIAKKVSMTASAVQKRSERARKRLRSILDTASI